MKLSVSLPDEDIEFLDAYARAQGAASRSAVVREAVRLLRASELASDYAQAWDEWAGGDDSEVWESTLATACHRPPDAPRRDPHGRS